MVLRLAYNLLENASKHSPPGSKIGVSTYIDQERDHAVMEIRDDGPGLDPEEINQCFDRFGGPTSRGLPPALAWGFPW
jgi:signal transduction histidine kinase